MLPSKNQRMVCTKTSCCLLFVFGIVLAIFCERMFNVILERVMVLRPNSEIYRVWESPPLDLHLNIYMFNWTNSDDFSNHSIKPVFEELGPYRFIEKPRKVDINWHPENASITYRKRSYFYFDAENSVGTLDDKITTINSLALVLARKAQNWNSIRRSVIDIALSNVYHNDFRIKRSVRELLFGGYDDVLLNIANVIPSSITDVVVPFDKFGYCYPRNGSSEVSGIFNMHTGADDIRKLGKVHTWNYQTHTGRYASECDSVHSSAGEFQAPYLQEQAPLEIFLPDICRAIKLDYENTTEVDGFVGYKYAGATHMLDNGTVHPQNACHCNGRCLPSGVVNISSCWFGSPMFMSLPHFYNADPHYANQVVGLQPEKKKHELYIVLEKKTGFMLEMGARMQANVLLEPVEELRMFRKARTLMFPLFWFEETTHLTPELAENMRLLPRAILASQIFGSLCFLTGVVLLLWNTLAVCMHRRLLQHINIADLEQNSSHIKVKDAADSPPDVSPLLRRAANNLPKHISFVSAKSAKDIGSSSSIS